MYTDGIVKINGRYIFPERYVARSMEERRVMMMQNNGQNIPQELKDYMEKRMSDGNKRDKDARKSAANPGHVPNQNRAVTSRDIVG